MLNRGPFTILLVEDDPAHAELVIRSLGEHPLANHIIHVSDGEAALDYLFKRGDYSDMQDASLPHVVLLDMRLPRVHGLDVLAQIRATPALSKIPVVILSTSQAEQDVARAYECHANSYIVKPMDFVEFTKLMREIGDYWLGWNYHPWS